MLHEQMPTWTLLEPSRVDSFETLMSQKELIYIVTTDIRDRRVA